MDVKIKIMKEQQKIIRLRNEFLTKVSFVIALAGGIFFALIYALRR